MRLKQYYFQVYTIYLFRQWSQVMLYLLNISGAFIVSDFQIPFVLKVFPTSHSTFNPYIYY